MSAYYWQIRASSKDPNPQGEQRLKFPTSPWSPLCSHRKALSSALPPQGCVHPEKVPFLSSPTQMDAFLLAQSHCISWWQPGPSCRDRCEPGLWRAWECVTRSRKASQGHRGPLKHLKHSLCVESLLRVCVLSRPELRAMNRNVRRDMWGEPDYSGSLRRSFSNINRARVSEGGDLCRKQDLSK